MNKLLKSKQLPQDWNNVIERNKIISYNLSPQNLRKLDQQNRNELVYSYASSIITKMTADYQIREQQGFLNSIIDELEECHSLLQDISKNPLQIKQGESFQYQQSLETLNVNQIPDQFVQEVFFFLVDCELEFKNQKVFPKFFNYFYNFLSNNFAKKTAELIERNQVLKTYLSPNKRGKVSSEYCKKYTERLLTKMLTTIHELPEIISVNPQAMRRIQCTFYLANIYQLKYYAYVSCFNYCLFNITPYSEIQQINIFDLQTKILSALGLVIFFTFYQHLLIFYLIQKQDK